ncbi:Uncharacterised protein [Segatella copri]|nr:Uncharacterised protein [Segatella copri]
MELFLKLLPLQGAMLIASIPRALLWAKSFWAFSPFLNHLQKIRKNLYPRSALYVKFHSLSRTVISASSCSSF